MPAPITTTSKGGPPEFIASSHVLHTKRPMRSTVKDVCSKAMTIIASWALQFRRERGLVYRAGSKNYRDNVPLPSGHADKSGRTDDYSKPIYGVCSRENDMQPKPDREI